MLTSLVTALSTIITSIVRVIPQIITTIVRVIPQIVSGLVNAIVGNIDKIIMAGVPFRPVTRIEDMALAAILPLIKTLTFERTIPPAFNANLFEGINNITSIRVPFESVVRYRNLPALSAFRNRIIGGCVVRRQGIRPPHLCNCRFRLGDVNGNASIEVNDALRVIQFDIGSSSTNIVLNPPNNPLFASLISHRARTEGRPRQLDAEVIMDNVVRLPNCIEQSCRLPCSICRR